MQAVVILYELIKMYTVLAVKIKVDIIILIVLLYN